MNHSVILETRDISKRFRNVLANDGVDFRLRTGEIHAVLGENGAGKSTLMNIICGLYVPDAGSIYIAGAKVEIKTPRHAIEIGIGMVHQHFMLVPNLTVAENIMLGAETTRRGFIDQSKAKRKIRRLAEKFGLAVDPEAVVGDLPVGVQQRVEIIKTLYRGAKILVLDEPTAVLTPQEVEKLFRVLHQLRANNVSIIFISHKLGETMTIADRISIMRRGRLVQTTLPAQTGEKELAALMIGREVSSESVRASSEAGKAILEVDHLTVVDDRKLKAVREVSFCVREGEILGIAGVQGSGQTELVAALNGLCSIEAGAIKLAGEDLALLRPRQILESGVAHVPEDRKKHGLVQEYSIADNQVLNTYFRRPFAHHWHRNFDAVQEHSHRLMKQFDIRAAGSSEKVATLSGGNQQKVILSRELSRDIRLLIANQPTRGLDVGAVEYVHQQLLAIRDRGVAVLLISVELDEIMSLSDTVAVMYEGQIVAMHPVDRISREQLGLLITGA
jgi:simple sugar transport system ATP-binding protein